MEKERKALKQEIYSFRAEANDLERRGQEIAEGRARLSAVRDVEAERKKIQEEIVELRSYADDLERRMDELVQGRASLPDRW
jgi:seryl-tRNA synthetase